MFEWITDPSAWAGLATLVVLELVLGIDNLVFIAILADRLPPGQRDKARLIGLALAMLQRLLLLASIAWIVRLTEPLFTVAGLDVSARDLIMLLGGFFLLFKATIELHQRIEGRAGHDKERAGDAIFWQVIVQIVVLDAVFSLDSVITAVGMVDELAVMMIAVIVAVIMMMVSSKSLMDFVSRHQTVVILCLAFLMMIGLSLIVEGFGFHVPKSYLYAAIGFSILIEALNQAARRNRERLLTTGNLRDRAADAVLHLLGSRRAASMLDEKNESIAERSSSNQIFAPEERAMTESVLELAERPARSIMTPRREIAWLDIGAGDDDLRGRILELGHSHLPLARGSLDEFIGVARARDLLRDMLEGGRINLERSVRQPLVVHESIDVLRLMEQLRQAALPMAMLVDEYGALQGIATPIDILEAIAGEFPDQGETAANAEQREDGSWLVDGGIDIRRVSKLIGADLVDDAERYSTLAGFVLWQLGELPEPGARIVVGDLVFEVVSMSGRNIDRVAISRAPEE